MSQSENSAFSGTSCIFPNQRSHAQRKAIDRQRHVTADGRAEPPGETLGRATPVRITRMHYLDAWIRTQIMSHDPCPGHLCRPIRHWLRLKTTLRVRDTALSNLSSCTPRSLDETHITHSKTPCCTSLRGSFREKRAHL